jgi:hypothetical protein
MFTFGTGDLQYHEKVIHATHDGPAGLPERALLRRLLLILAGQRFPAHRWELIAEAHSYGADAHSVEQLQALPERRYNNLLEVLWAVDRRSRR